MTTLRERIEGLTRWDHFPDSMDDRPEGDYLVRSEVLAALEAHDEPVGQAAGEQLYFIQDKRQYVGNDVLWWRPDGGGYTCQIDEAGRFTAERCQRLRDTDVVWRVEDILPLATRVVDMQRMRGVAPVGGTRQKPPEIAWAPGHGPLWHKFPSEAQIRAWPHWWRRNGSRTLKVELRFQGADLLDDTWEGPPLCLSGSQSADLFAIYLMDMWQMRKVADRPLPTWTCCGDSYELGETFGDCPKCGKPMSAL